MAIDWIEVQATLEKSIERNQHANGAAVPLLAATITALPIAEERAAVQRAEIDVQRPAVVQGSE